MARTGRNEASSNGDRRGQSTRDALPDIVLVVFDTARWDRFGCYGYPRPTTPTVDALAREGSLVRTMIANGPWTPPSHASLFTGLYPAQHGCQWQTGISLRPSVRVTMAEWLWGLGYTTICATNNGLVSDRTGLARGFERYGYRMDLESPSQRAVRQVKRAAVGAESGGRVVNRWIRRQLTDVRADRPVFLFVNYRECHWSYAPPPRFVRRVGGPRFRPTGGLRYRTRIAARVGPWEAVARASPRELDIYSTMYDGELATADHHLEDLLGILSRAGRLRPGGSMVMVTSDHGEHVGEHGLADHHASLDDHLIRVPFVAWGPGRIAAQERLGMYEFVDVLPSLARHLKLPTPQPGLRDRRMDLFENDGGPAREGNAVRGADDPETFAFAEWRHWGGWYLKRLARRNPSYQGFDRLAQDLVAVRTARHKLVRWGDGTERLFDLDRDPAEEHDVRSQLPEVSTRLRSKLDDAQDEWETSPPTADDGLDAADTREIEARLSELGYI